VHVSSIKTLFGSVYVAKVAAGKGYELELPTIYVAMKEEAEKTISELVRSISIRRGTQLNQRENQNLALALQISIAHDQNRLPQASSKSTFDKLELT
jgi:hypothetical protein